MYKKYGGQHHIHTTVYRGYQETSLITDITGKRLTSIHYITTNSQPILRWLVLTCIVFIKLLKLHYILTNTLSFLTTFPYMLQKDPPGSVSVSTLTFPLLSFLPHFKTLCMHIHVHVHGMNCSLLPHAFKFFL